MTGPQWPVREAVERYLRSRRVDASDSSISTWRYRLKLFAEWCDTQGIATVDQLDAWHLDDYYHVRAGDVAPATLEGEMWTLQSFAAYVERFDGVPDDLADAVQIPDVDAADRTSETMLDEDRALALLADYREHDAGTREHVFLDLAWVTGARMGALRALDRRDVHLDDGYVLFQHRPDQGTPLKNKVDGERAVAIPGSTQAAIRAYYRRDRNDVRDDHGRDPLLTTQQGRVSRSSLRTWSYLATQPCIRRDCPHGKQRATCDWVTNAAASKCPSSRSPHDIRTGSITWQLNTGIPPEIVAQRVNASLSTIEQHYDHESPVERMERRRRQYIDRLTTTPDTNDD